jgi:diadenosine tetraphosphate (Ap4A) HIT family hydrolase
MTTVHEGVERARAGKNPAVICRMPSGWAVLCDMQYLRGYTILLPDPVVGSINDLDREQRAAFLCDMVTVGDALLEVTGAYRINYGIMGNSDPFLHAHITPRYQSEPEANRHHLPWSYPKEIMNSNLFDYERDQELIAQLAGAIRKRL